MNEHPRGIPLRPDLGALGAADRRSFVRACTAIVLGKKSRDPEAVLRAWRDDAVAARFLKAVQTPTSTADFPQAVATLVLPMLSPSSASGRLLGLAASVDLAGIDSVLLPYVGATGRPAVPFVSEGTPAPVVNLTVSSARV